MAMTPEEMEAQIIDLQNRVTTIESQLATTAPVNATWTTAESITGTISVLAPPPTPAAAGVRRNV